MQVRARWTRTLYKSGTGGGTAMTIPRELVASGFLGPGRRVVLELFPEGVLLRLPEEPPQPPVPAPAAAAPQGPEPAEQGHEGAVQETEG